MNLWLAYVSYPITTARYLEKAFRKNHQVTTIGPQVSSEQLVLTPLILLVFHRFKEQYGWEPKLPSNNDRAI